MEIINFDIGGSGCLCVDARNEQLRAFRDSLSSSPRNSRAQEDAAFEDTKFAAPLLNLTFLFDICVLRIVRCLN